MLRPPALAFVLVLAGACSTGSTSAPPAAADGGTDEAGDGDAGAAPSVCAVTRAFVERCAGDLNCGPEKFDAWCAANDSAVNSDAYRRAEAKCLPDVACNADARRACEYEAYGGETPTEAQRTLVDAYCRTCEPGDVAGCTTRSTTYDPAGGPDAVSDIFIAAWELSDPLVEQIRAKCTGGALDAGAAGATSCAKAFASCAAEPYLGAVPDCP